MVIPIISLGLALIIGAIYTALTPQNLASGTLPPLGFDPPRQDNPGNSDPPPQTGGGQSPPKGPPVATTPQSIDDGQSQGDPNIKRLVKYNKTLSSDEFGQLPGSVQDLANRGYDFTKHFVDGWDNPDLRGYNLTADKIINVLKNGSHILRDGDDLYSAVGKINGQIYRIVYDDEGTLHTIFPGSGPGLFEYINRPDFPFDR